MTDPNAPSSQLLQALRRDEGERGLPYKDSRGFLTIADGILIDSRVPGCPGLTHEECDLLLAHRAGKVQAEVLKALPWIITHLPARRDVLYEMAYQMGVGGLLRFDGTLMLIRTGDYIAASQGMVHTAWATETPERAHRLATQMRTGTYAVLPTK